MDWLELRKLIPALAATVNPLAGVLAQQLLEIAEKDLDKKQAESPAKSRDEVLAEMEADLQEGLIKARILGDKPPHEELPPKVEEQE